MKKEIKPYPFCAYIGPLAGTEWDAIEYWNERI